MKAALVWVGGVFRFSPRCSGDEGGGVSLCEDRHLLFLLVRRDSEAKWEALKPFALLLLRVSCPRSKHTGADVDR